MDASTMSDEQIDAMMETFYQESQCAESQGADGADDDEGNEEDDEDEEDEEEEEEEEEEEDGTRDILGSNAAKTAYQNAFERHLVSSGVDVNRSAPQDAPSTQCTEALSLDSQTDAERCLDVFAITTAQLTPMPAPPLHLFDTGGYVRTTKVPCSSRQAADAATKRSQPFNNVPLPLLIRDILRVRIPDGSTLSSEREIYGRRFRTVMFYGRCEPVSTRGARSTGASSDERCDTNKRIYRVDDGSASIVVYFAHASKQYQDTQRGIARLSQLYEDSCRSGIPFLGGDYSSANPKCREMLGHLNAIIGRVKRNACVRQDYFGGGSKLCVIGTPFLNTATNTVQVFAFNVREDCQANRDLEVDFKRTLCDFYDQRYLSSRRRK